MKSFNNKTSSQFVNNEKGYVLLTSMMMLTLLTIIGIAATNTSNIDLQIATAEKNMQQAFYSAEAGIEHARLLLSERYSDYNKAALLLNNAGDWDFAIDGRETGKSAATDNDGDNIPDYEGGAVWLCKSPLTSKVTYTVTVWNNEDELTPDTDGNVVDDRLGADGVAGGGDDDPDNEVTDDEDGILFVRSDGFGPNGARAAIQISLQRGANIETYSRQSYDAQASGGQGKSGTNSIDLNAVDTSTRQL